MSQDISSAGAERNSPVQGGRLTRSDVGQRPPLIQRHTHANTVPVTHPVRPPPLVRGESFGVYGQDKTLESSAGSEGSSARRERPRLSRSKRSRINIFRRELDTLPRSGPCQVCSSSSCRLISHQQFAAGLRAKTASSTAVAAPSVALGSHKPARPRPQPVRSVTSATSTDIIKETTPNIVRLSLADPNLRLPKSVDDKILKQLFYDFFTTNSQMLAKERRRLVFARDFQDYFLTQALVDEALCMACISLNVAFLLDQSAQLTAVDSLGSARIFNQTCRLINQSLQDGPTETTLVAVLAMTVAQGIFTGDRAALQTHLRGARSVAAALGGLTNINGGFVHIFQDTEYTATLLDLDTMEFPSTEMVILPIQNPPKPVYGQSFHELARVLDRGLYSTCTDTCRLTELLEDRATSLAAGETANPSRWTYFQYLRNTLSIRLAQTHTEHRGTNTIGECVSLAMNLYQLTVLRVICYKKPLQHLCTRLQTILTNPQHFQSILLGGSVYATMMLSLNGHSFIPQCTIVWILYVVSMTFQMMGHVSHDWALDLLLNTLETQYRSAFRYWPAEWREEQLDRLKKFCWPDVFLAEKFRTTCNLLAVRASLR